MSKHRSKRYQKAAALVKAGQTHPLAEAVALIKQFPAPKFDQSVTVSFHLGVDPRKSDQMVRGTCPLPHGSGKKVRVATEVASAIGLKNVTFRHARAEEEKQTFDFVVSRAVMPLADLIKIIKKNISVKQQNALPNGLICLKGGELEHEAMPFKHKTVMHNLSDEFEEEFFKTKKVVYVTV